LLLIGFVPLFVLYRKRVRVKPLHLVSYKSSLMQLVPVTPAKD
jgi:hypothetical protein